MGGKRIPHGLHTLQFFPPETFIFSCIKRPFISGSFFLGGGCAIAAGSYLLSNAGCIREVGDEMVTIHKSDKQTLYAVVTSNGSWFKSFHFASWVV